MDRNLLTFILQTPYSFARKKSFLAPIKVSIRPAADARPLAMTAVWQAHRACNIAVGRHSIRPLLLLGRA